MTHQAFHQPALSVSSFILCHLHPCIPQPLPTTSTQHLGLLGWSLWTDTHRNGLASHQPNPANSCSSSVTEFKVTSFGKLFLTPSSVLPEPLTWPLLRSLSRDTSVFFCVTAVSEVPHLHDTLLRGGPQVVLARECPEGISESC